MQSNESVLLKKYRRTHTMGKYANLNTNLTYNICSISIGTNTLKSLGLARINY